ncbi:MAG: formylglycine-generating enzyme family protein [Bacteroidales bacterium]|nr:formylglycine-generating enzyme family protein [Bacteroidales bacterium]
MKRCIFSFVLWIVCYSGITYSQNLVMSTNQGIKVIGFTDRNKVVHKVPGDFPLFTFQVNGKICSTAEAKAKIEEAVVNYVFEDNISIEVFTDTGTGTGWKCNIVIYNNSSDTVDIENIVPFGETGDHVYLTSTGPWALARAKIFRPGLGPVGVILPDNAWELGYGAISLNEELSVCAIARRAGSRLAEPRRYRTVVYPGGHVGYVLWADEFRGEWQNGLRMMFRDRYLYDLDTFDNNLYHRHDLQWIRHDYLIGLQFAWNREYFDWKEQEYTVDSFLERGKRLFGGYDVIGLWPTWPRLGVDQRNQWDLFDDLPGGLSRLKAFSQQWKKEGTKLFVCYNPWDESTRSEDPYAGMARLIEATDADGVVLDCHGSSSHELQKSADSIKPGVIMYSEGMAVVKDMPGIVAGRVHDAIYLPPPLNLNKLIKPDFAIFRVCQVHDGRIRREASVALFNGYGTELNTFAPGQFDNMEEDLVYLGRTTRILRENTSNFQAYDWTPLLNTLQDSIWVNKWASGEKTVFTLFSLVPEGYSGPLFEDQPASGKHAVSLWHHDELEWTVKNGRHYLPVKVFAFNSFEMGTRTEGNIDCIAILPEVIRASISNGKLTVASDRGEEIKIWAGNPSYQNEKVKVLPAGEHEFNLLEIFGTYEGKFVIQVFQANELLDERVLSLEPGTPRLISNVPHPPATSTKREGTVFIPGGAFEFQAENTDQFIPYPDVKEPVSLTMEPFYMDKYPVTNRQFKVFLDDSGYIPEDTVNFLKHWDHDNIPPILEDHPVVYISLEDARAYASWAGKRLPTETEWQYSAQGKDNRKWPWGNEFDSTRCNHATGKTTPVDAFPEGISPFGVMDLTGNVWQLTGDVYDNGTYYFVIMKGGSHYRPTSSWWYVKGGPQPNNWHQQLLLVSPSFDRNATVGFRCVRDAAK